MEIITTATLFLLIFILAGWIYRSWRSLSELKQAPTLRILKKTEGQSLGTGTVPTYRQGKVSILIPAKNEEKNIADCVKPFLAQLREDDEILVINNCSGDRTEAILKELGAREIKGTGSVFRQGGRAPFPAEKEPVPGKTVPVPLKYLNTPQTPAGWTGKNYALHLGVQHAAGDWLLFTDADTRHEPGSLNAALVFAEENELDLLTLLPRCITGSFWEDTIQPCAMGYMGLWFPIKKINDPKSKVYFGNGQYLLLRAEHYRKIGGHDGVKEAFLEDFAIMKKTREIGARGMCAFGMEVYGTRMYESFDAIWRGWRRIFLHAFDQKPAAIFKCVLSVFFFSVFPFAVLIALPDHFSAASFLCILLLVIIFATALKAHAIVKAKKRYALLHPLAALVFTAILFDAFLTAAFKRPTRWR
jgi:chlorobactene glucosyltransferase